MAMAMDAPSFCYMSDGFGVKKLDKLYLLNRHSINRIQQVVHLPDAIKRPLASRKQLNSVPVHHHRLWRCIADMASHHTVELDNDTPMVKDDEESFSKATLIWRAIKLPIYAVALIPITVGMAVVYLETGQYFGKRYVVFLVSSFLAIAWVNLSNDVYDFDTGADGNKRESVVNLSGSRTVIHILAWLSLLLGFFGLVWVALESRSLYSVILSGYAVLCGLLYQCPPFRLGYIGLGEPLCFAAFGPFVTTTSYLLLGGPWEQSIPGIVVSSSLLVGLTTSLILFSSHFHQIEDDRAVGKLSPLVRLGTAAGSKVVKAAVTALYSLVLVLGLMGSLPLSSVVLCALTLPMGKKVVSFVEKNHDDKEKIFLAKYYSVRLHTVFGAALAAGLVGARLLARKQLPHSIIL